MSHVLDIRRRTAQERLRSDHIDLLYQLESLNKENNNLQNKLKLLENEINLLKNNNNNNNNNNNDLIQLSSLPSTSLPSSSSSSSSLENNNNNNLNEEETKKLKNDLNNLENEFKTLKMSFNLLEKSRQNQKENTKLIENNLKQKEDLLLYNMMYCEDLISYYLREKEKHQNDSIKHDSNEQIKNLELNYSKLKSTSKQEKLELQNELNILQNNYSKLQHEYSQLELSYQKLEIQNQQTFKQLSHFQNLYESLKQLKLEQKLIDQSCQTDEIETIQIENNINNDSSIPIDLSNDIPDDNSLTEPDIQPSQHGIPPPEFHSFNINEKESSKNSQNFSFQEYIRLKRENLSLRVLLANSTNSSNNISQLHPSTPIHLSNNSPLSNTKSSSINHPSSTTSALLSSTTNNFNNQNHNHNNQSHQSGASQRIRSAGNNNKTLFRSTDKKYVR